MQLYFSPMSSSLAVRIALYEAGLPAEFIEVHLGTKRLSNGGDYREVHPLGLVPLLELENGARLTEVAAILTWIAERSGAVPTDLHERARLSQWLTFTASELHLALFSPLLDATAPEAVRAYACARGEARLGWLSGQLEGREWLGQTFSIADVYLLTTLSWCAYTPIELHRWPTLLAYLKRGLKRPQVARALAEEKVLYMAAQTNEGVWAPRAG
ncbi:MAG TPA: glutathione S-transferase N-terminal domain-containing protein [Myxococcaceae bacterium]|nr:glutathione S-transferase N-terminal domain-containing protein [Myxococcaceae bacterium]